MAGAKALARAERKERQDAKFALAKAKLVERVHPPTEPIIACTPDVDKTPRLAPHLQHAANKQQQQPKAIYNASRFTSPVTWCARRADLLGEWSWGEPRSWEADEWSSVIEPPLQNFETMTWAEIDKCTSDTGHKLHHTHSIEDVIDEAQDRWLALDLAEFETIFRFRLGGVRRLWGFIVQAHFHIIWWDRDHSIYPTEPS